jgi:hypothetical protein
MTPSSAPVRSGAPGARIDPVATNAPFDVARIRADFPILKRTVRGKPLVYLDSHLP